MKRILFYTIICCQLFIILFLTYQFESMERNGQEIKLLTTPDESSYDMAFEGTIYVEYEINKVDEEKWEDSQEANDHKLVYVLLKKDANGIYDVERASSSKLSTANEDEIVLIANYQYHDDFGYHHVRYGLESVEQAQQFGNYRTRDRLVVTALVGKWGQLKITNVEKSTQ